MNIIRSIIKYKNNNFSSWLEFFLTFGVCKFEDGGFLLFIYGYGGLIGIVGMYFITRH